MLLWGTGVRCLKGGAFCAPWGVGGAYKKGNAQKAGCITYLDEEKRALLR